MDPKAQPVCDSAPSGGALAPSSVVLRPLRSDDSAQVLDWRNSQTVAPYMYSDRPILPDQHRRWLGEVLVDPARRYWIIEADDVAVGLANVVGLQDSAGRCEWAYYLGDPSVRGRGIGACVEYLVLRHVFETLGLNKLWCEVFFENEAVWRLHESFGFRREAELRAHVLKDGHLRDVMGLGLLRSEWPLAKAKAEDRLRSRRIDCDQLRVLDREDWVEARAGQAL